MAWRPIMNRVLKTLFMVSASLNLALLDNSIKENIEDGTIDNGVIEKTGGFLEIEKHHNKGLVLNKLEGHTKEITAVSSAVLFVHFLRTVFLALTKRSPLDDIANSIILSGAMSNTYDRIKRGYVVDYIKAGKKRTVFNISDCLIFSGIILILVKTIIKAILDIIRGRSIDVESTSEF